MNNSYEKLNDRMIEHLLEIYNFNKVSKILSGVNLDMCRKAIMYTLLNVFKLEKMSNELYGSPYVELSENGLIMWGYLDDLFSNLDEDIIKVNFRDIQNYIDKELVGDLEFLSSKSESFKNIEFILDNDVYTGKCNAAREEQNEFLVNKNIRQILSNFYSLVSVVFSINSKEKLVKEINLNDKICKLLYDAILENKKLKISALPEYINKESDITDSKGFINYDIIYKFMVEDLYRFTNKGYSLEFNSGIKKEVLNKLRELSLNLLELKGFELNKDDLDNNLCLESLANIMVINSRFKLNLLPQYLNDIHYEGNYENTIFKFIKEDLDRLIVEIDIMINKEGV